MNKYKTFAELKEELGKDFDVYMYQSNIELLTKINKAINKIQYIRDLGFDYDGFNNVEDLKGLIDDLVRIAGESIDILKGDDYDDNRESR